MDMGGRRGERPSLSFGIFLIAEEARELQLRNRNVTVVVICLQ